MKLTVARLMEVLPLITQIINEKRPMPQKGSYRLARLHAKLLPEYATASASRDAMIKAYDTHERIPVTLEGAMMGRSPGGDGMMDGPNYTVPLDKLEEFTTFWAEIAKEEIEVDVQPIPLAQLDMGDDKPSTINALELVVLGDLVAE